MFAKFIYTSFPIVIVKFSRDIENTEDFDEFLKKWIELYENKKDFIFVFDATQVGYPSVKYCVRMSMFIKKLRKEKIHYLKKSIIIVKNNRVKNLLNFTFYLQPPVATVYLTKDTLSKVLANVYNIKNINVDKTIYPGKPFIPIL